MLAMSARIDIENFADSFDCPDDVDVLHGMMALGRKGIPVGCRGGGCGVCKVQVLAGEYHTGKMSRARVTVEEERAGYALACRLFALTSLRLRVVGQMARAFDPAWISTHCSGVRQEAPGSVNWRK